MSNPPIPDPAPLPLELERRFLSILDEPHATHAQLLQALCAENAHHAATLRDWYAEWAATADRDDACPERLGHYRILRRLGGGGMGVVYLAEQEAPVRRLVALKIARQTIESVDGWRRFELEQQVMARMDHSAIARVFDAGQDPLGRPYLVMELVDGQPITCYCDARRLGIDDRLRLLQQVCEGVQHAHQRGVIHRDIKSSNVLVAEEGGRPMPKVIDFGLARLIDQKAHPLHTHSDLVLGTPAYMSPEQAGLARDIDTRTDVYGLGVVLYELLTGALPLTHAELARSAREEMLRRIREAEPPPPSRRAHDAAPRVAGDRSATTATLWRRLRGDLDWITLRALAKDRDRRYGSPAELGNEIERYLRREPVLAGPPSAWYRLRRLASRHRAMFAAAVGIVVAVLLGLVASTLAWRETAAKVREFDHLALVVQLERARATAAGLFPALPLRVRDIEAWLAEHEALERILPAVAGFVADLRAQGRPATAHEREVHAAQDAQTGALSALAARCADLDGSIASVVAKAKLEPVEEIQRDNAKVRLARLKPELEDLRERIADRASTVFARPADRFLYAAVVTLRHDLNDFIAPGGLLQQMRNRWRFARDVEARTLHEQAAAWAAVAAGVRGDPRLAGVELRPQIGLIPIGKDPHSGLWEFLHLASHDPAAPIPARDAGGNLQFSAECGVVLVLIPGGVFTMGEQDDDPAAPNYNPDADSDAPAHAVTLAPFFLAKYELTQAQWRRMSGGEEPSSYSARMKTRYGQPSWTCPVEMVSWKAARALLEKHDLALPTEAQWEYACRAGTTTLWWTGNSPASLQGAANLPDRSVTKAGLNFGEASEELDDGFIGPAPVDALRPNPFGLHHMHGNVWEWCEDYHESYTFPVRAGDGLRQVPTMLARSRVYRGGSWYERVALSRSAHRWSEAETVHWEVTGVRAARLVRTE